MQLNRLFYRWSHVDSGWAYTDIEKNIDAGRFPWVSFKLPGSWTDVAEGKYDEDILRMLQTLDGFGVPIWLTMHHEPEGGGGINNADESSGSAGHKAMNRRVRYLMNLAGTENIALSLVLMGWTWDPASGRDPNEWWSDGLYDFLGIDPYVAKTATMLNTNWYRIMDWAWDRGVDVGVAEWGIQGGNIQAAGYMQELYDYCVTSVQPRVTSLAYFDVPGDWHAGEWVLEGAQLDKFHTIMRENAVVPEPEARFEDVPKDHIFYEDVEWIAAQGITKGCNPPENTLYCPDRPVTRGEMAAFLHRALAKE